MENQSRWQPKQEGIIDFDWLEETFLFVSFVLNGRKPSPIWHRWVFNKIKAKVGVWMLWFSYEL